MIEAAVVGSTFGRRASMALTSTFGRSSTFATANELHCRTHIGLQGLELPSHVRIVEHRSARAILHDESNLRRSQVGIDGHHRDAMATAPKNLPGILEYCETEC